MPPTRVILKYYSNAIVLYTRKEIKYYTEWDKNGIPVGHYLAVLVGRLMAVRSIDIPTRTSTT